MTPGHVQLLCTHAPAYQRGCVACGVRYMKMLRSPDARASRRLQDQFLSTLPAALGERIKEILTEEHNAIHTPA